MVGHGEVANCGPFTHVRQRLCVRASVEGGGGRGNTKPLFLFLPFCRSNMVALLCALNGTLWLTMVEFQTPAAPLPAAVTERQP